MQVLNKDGSEIVIKMTKDQFQRIVSAIEAVEQYIDDIDPYIVKSTPSELKNLRNELYDLMR